MYIYYTVCDAMRDAARTVGDTLGVHEDVKREERSTVEEIKSKSRSLKLSCMHLRQDTACDVASQI